MPALARGDPHVAPRRRARLRQQEAEVGEAIHQLPPHLQIAESEFTDADPLSRKTAVRSQGLILTPHAEAVDTQAVCRPPTVGQPLRLKTSPQL